MNLEHKSLPFEPVTVSAGVRPEVWGELIRRAELHGTTVAALIRQALAEYLEPPLLQMTDTADGFVTILALEVHDREAIGGLITDRQGYATDRDIDYWIIEATRERRGAMDYLPAMQ